MRRLGDRVIGDWAGITASLRVRECMSTADRVGFIVLVVGRRSAIAMTNHPTDTIVDSRGDLDALI